MGDFEGFSLVFSKEHFAQLRIHQQANKSFAVKSFALQNAKESCSKSKGRSSHNAKTQREKERDTERERVRTLQHNRSKKQQQNREKNRFKTDDLAAGASQILMYLCICIRSCNSTPPRPRHISQAVEMFAEREREREREWEYAMPAQLDLAAGKCALL